jgi:glycosyltransferase involved in cell wall biosynthesis
MEQIKFSIIVPIYKVEKYIHKCIESLINQTYKNIEILLIDDGSPDQCPKICDEYAAQHDYVYVYHKKNRGLSDARNYGLARANGEFIIFVDSDDYIDIDSCYRFNKILEENSQIDVLASNSRVFGNVEQNDEMYTIFDGVISGESFLKEQFKKNTMYVTAWRNIYRRSFLLNNKLLFKFGILHEDEQWTPRVFLNAENVLVTDFVFYNHNIRQGSITQQKVKTKNAEDIVSTCNELRPIYESLEDNELKMHLLDYLVKLYLHAFYIGKHLHKTEYYDYEFLKKSAISKKNKRNLKLLLANKYFYYYYRYLRSRYINRNWLKKWISN